MEGEKIIYILIAYGEKPLAGYSPYKGDFIMECEQQMKQCKPNSSAAFVFENYKICYQNVDNITYMVMTSKTYPNPATVVCLDSMIKDYKEKFISRNLSQLKNHQLDNEFKDSLKQKFDYYTEHSDIVDQKVQDLKEVMMQFKEQVFQAKDDLVQRGEELNKLDAQSETLVQDSFSFKQGAINVRKTECRRKMWYIIVLAVAIIIIVGIIIWIVS